MNLDYATLESMRILHPAWRLLRSDHAALMVSFLNRMFVIPNVRLMPAADLAEALEDELYSLRERLGDDAFPKPAAEYLTEWAGPERGWLRKFYLAGSDEPQYDLTPATEKVIAWLATLAQRGFVGTESRLLTVFDLLRQMSEGSETDPAVRISDLQGRRAQIDAEILRIERGDVPVLDDAAVKDRFQQFMQLARELLTDFREVEQNFRMLDRRVRERIALWEGGKATLLENILGERDAIADSDQGRSFRAFWDFLMSSRRQEEFTALLSRVLSLPSVIALQPEARTRRVHYDWLEAGEHTQRTVAQLSQQLRRFLDDRTWLENRRIMDILHSIEARALGLRADPPRGDLMALPATAAQIELSMERPLYTPKTRPLIDDMVLDDGAAEIDATALYTQVFVDKARLAHHIRHALQERTQITLRELVETQPLQKGLAELVAYLQLGTDSFRTVVDENQSDVIAWQNRNPTGKIAGRFARLPRVLFVR